MKSFNENWDGITRNKQPLNEDFKMEHFADLGKFARQIISHAEGIKSGKKKADAQSFFQIANAIGRASYQEEDHLSTIIFSLEFVRDKISKEDPKTTKELESAIVKLKEIYNRLRKRVG